MNAVTCSYNTYNQHYKEVQCFQQQVEPLLVKYGVNFVFFGEPTFLPQNDRLQFSMALAAINEIFVRF